MTKSFNLASRITPITGSTSTRALIAHLRSHFSSSVALLGHVPIALALRISSMRVVLTSLLGVSSSAIVRLSGLTKRPLSVGIGGVLLNGTRIIIIGRGCNLHILRFGAHSVGSLTP